MRLSRIYLWVIAATVVAAIALLINERFGLMFLYNSSGVLIGILALTLAYAVVGLGCAAAYENGKAPRLMRSGMMIGLIALVCWSALALAPVLQQGMLPLRLFMWLTVWPCLMMVSGLLLLLPMQRGWRWWARAATLVMLAALALFIAGAFTFYPGPVYYTAGGWDERAWEQVRRYEELAYQIGWALGLLTAGSLATTLIIGIMGALTGRTAPMQPVTRMAYWLQCPRCGREQEALTGDHHCIACNLRTKVELV